MSDVSTAIPAAPEPIPTDIISRKAGGEGPISIRDAARSVQDARYKDKPQDEQPSSPEAPANELAPEANADSPPETTGEDQAAEPETPAIDPPRSWTKEANERWSKLDRETQKWIVERDREDQAAIKRALNEAADKRKAAEAEHETGTKARQQYEQALPVLLQTLYQQQAGEFADIQSMADVERLAREDFPRYAVWDAQQKKIAAVQGQLQETQHRQSQEAVQRWNDFVKTEDDKFAEKVPEIADAAKAPKLREAAVGVLKDHGFKEDEIGALWTGQAPLSLRDHRVQLLIHDAIKFREAKAAAKKAEAKPVPPVQRPGVAPSRTDGKEAVLKDLSSKIDKAKGIEQIRAAARFVNARRDAG